MTKVRARVSDVLTVFGAQQAREVALVAGNNVLSRAEQAKAAPHIAQAADALRAEGRSRVTTDALQDKLMEQARALIGGVNQSSGSGAAVLSKTEADRAAARNPVLGLRVLAAYEVARGGGPNVDGIARERVSAGVTEPTEQVFKEFATEEEAVRYQDPDGRRVTWLVKEKDGLLKNSYVWGRDDMWAERFDIDRLDGSVTTTGEH